jgi:hypothetical protein
MDRVWYKWLKVLSGVSMLLHAPTYTARFQNAADRIGQSRIQVQLNYRQIGEYKCSLFVLLLHDLSAVTVQHTT